MNVEQLARLIIGPYMPVPEGSPFTLEHLQKVRWEHHTTEQERNHALFLAKVILEAQARESTDLPKVRHKKRGSTYDVLGEGEVQISTAPGRPERGQSARVLKEGDTMIVYRAHEDGKLWLRFPDEFSDGRFEEMTA